MQHACSLCGSDTHSRSKCPWDGAEPVVAIERRRAERPPNPDLDATRRAALQALTDDAQALGLYD